jgi:hypothetical protein
MAQRYLPSAPLLAAAMRGRPHHKAEACPYCLAGPAREDHKLCISDVEIAARVGVDAAMVGRWREGARVKASEAERYARAAGRVDYEVWPELLEAVVAQVEATCPTCVEVFLPTRKGHVFCSSRCYRRSPQAMAKDRERDHRRRADPVAAERERVKQAEYRAAARRALNLKQSARWHADVEASRARRRARYAANAEAERARQAEYRRRIREAAAA